MTVVKPFQIGTDNEMFVHLFWNALAQLLSMRRPLNDNKYSRVITRNGPVPQVLEDMEIAVKITRLSHWQANKDAINP